MAHNVEPMDIDHIDSEFDNKENSIHHSNVYPRTPCTEKGYEELDVSELNMKLRYSITPASSPMSRSFTANCADNRNLESGDDTLNANLTRSLHAAVSKTDIINKSVKTLPLQTISTEQLVDSNRNASVLRQLDSTAVVDNNVTVTVSQPHGIDENISFPSSSSSTAPTPEATTPTKEIPRADGGSPIMRGLKSVLNMFRSSQSPIPPADSTEIVSKQALSPDDISTSTPESSQSTVSVLASTPISAYKQKEGSLSKRCSPHKESLVFNEDLEKELLWKDETTILFSQEKIPIHKLFFQQPSKSATKNDNSIIDEDLNSTVEYMDISYNDSVVKNKTLTDLQHEGLNESDGEFVDCETTFTDKSRIEENEPTDKESELRETDIVSTATEVPLDVEEVLPQEAYPTEVSESNATITDNKDEIEMSITMPSTKEIGNGVPEIVTADKVETVENKENSNQNANTTVNINDGKTNEEHFTLTITQKSNTNIGREISEPSGQCALNMTFESSDPPADEIALNSGSIIVNSTLILPESDVDKAHFAASQDHVSNSTFIQQIESTPMISEVCDTTYSAKSETTFDKEKPIHSETINVPICHAEDITFVKEVGNVSSLSDEFNMTKSIAGKVFDATFHMGIGSQTDCIIKGDIEEPIKIENETFIKDHGSETLPSDASHTAGANVENATFIKESEAIDNNKTCNVGYSTFVKDIENNATIEETVNTSTPSTESFVQVSPANIPLPDEDDIENEKSLGTSMLVEENTVPIQLDINNTSNTKLGSENNIEQMPIDPAKSIDINSTINYPIEENGSVAEINNDRMESSRLSDIKTYYEADCRIVQEDKQYVYELKNNELLPQKFVMDINQSIYEEHPVDVQEIISNVAIKHNLDVSMEQVSNIANTVIDIQPLTKVEENIVVSEVIDANIQITHDTSDIERSKTDSDKPVATHNNDTKMPEAKDLAKNDMTADIIMKRYEDQLETKPVTENNQDVVLDETVSTNKTDVTHALEQNKLVGSFAVAIDNMVVEPSLDQVYVDQISSVSVEILDNSAIKNNDVQTNLPNNTDITILEKSMNVESVSLNESLTDKIYEKDEVAIENIIKEIVVSENNSPFVSVDGEIDIIPKESENVENAQNPFAPRSRVVLTPPSSPKIVSKGYNFNFDEIDDPFATKTKIRMSPTPETSPKDTNTTYEVKSEAPQRDINKNRRKSQPERKRPVIPKKKLNSTFSGPAKATKTTGLEYEPNLDKETKSNDSIVCNNTEKQQPPAELTENLKLSVPKNALDTTMNVEPLTEKFNKEEKSLDDRDVDTTSDGNIVEQNKVCTVVEDCAVTNESKATSSSEQSTYYSAGTSSGDSTVNKNVFNIPEIDDMNFNPFVTKSKMRQSLPPGLQETERETFDVTDLSGVESKVCDAVEDKECANLSSTSSKETDEKDITVREVHTEDEDTVEGPFLEADDNDKMSEFDDDVDMMQFSELPPQTNEENLETGEMFIDAEAFEFLLNQNKSNVVSDSGKESLFLKFDPLFAKRVSTDGVLAALKKVQKRQSTPKKMAPEIPMDSTFAVAGPSNLNITHEVDPTNIAEESTEDLNVTVSKPMMVVTPAVNPIVTPRNKPVTPTSSNRRSITFTSPAIAVIDRLLSLSANNSLMGHDTTVTVSREQNEADLALTQLRELLAEKEISVYNLRSESKELKDRLSSLESQMKTLETESEKRLQKVNELSEKLTEKTKINKSMAAVVEEYERTIASLIAETEQDKKRNNEERMKLIKERDEQTAHLASMEVSFSDLHSKYEKSKQIILTCKANEDSYKKSIKEFEENLSKMQSNYELLKQHATSKLNHANQELEKMNRAHESEVLKMNAMIKRKELHITSLEETLAQKSKANEELTAICDELINKVG